MGKPKLQKVIFFNISYIENQNIQETVKHLQDKHSFIF